MEWFYSFNVAFIFVSAYLSKISFARGNNFGGWINLTASALNAAVVLNAL